MIYFIRWSTYRLLEKAGIDFKVIRDHVDIEIIAGEEHAGMIFNCYESDACFVEDNGDIETFLRLKVPPHIQIGFTRISDFEFVELIRNRKVMLTHERINAMRKDISLAFRTNW